MINYFNILFLFIMSNRISNHSTVLNICQNDISVARLCISRSNKEMNLNAQTWYNFW